jgi:hypothetical protein
VVDLPDVGERVNIDPEAATGYADLRQQRAEQFGVQHRRLQLAELRGFPYRSGGATSPISAVSRRLNETLAVGLNFVRLTRWADRGECDRIR